MLAEERMAFVDAIADGDDTLGLSFNETWKRNTTRGHASTP